MRFEGRRKITILEIIWSRIVKCDKIINQVSDDPDYIKKITHYWWFKPYVNIEEYEWTRIRDSLTITEYRILMLLE
jgi:hypothetical protein